MTDDTDLVKVLFCLRRLPSLTPAEFHTHWRDVHGPLVQSRAAAVGIRRYIQHHGSDVPQPGLERPRAAAAAFDGVAEIWIDRRYLDERLSPEGLEGSRTLLEDEKRFIDLGASSIFSVESIEFPLAGFSDPAFRPLPNRVP